VTTAAAVALTPDFRGDTVDAFLDKAFCG